MLWGLYTLGLDREADDFFNFLADIAEEGTDLQIMDGIAGERQLDETELDHLSLHPGWTRSSQIAAPPAKGQAPRPWPGDTGP